MKNSKKYLTSLALSVLLISTMSLPSFAHHGYRNNSYQACNVDNCVTAGVHSHNNCNYQGHTSYCTFENCAETAAHTHNGVAYARSLEKCTVAGCTLAGNHLHDGVAYCHSYNGTAPANNYGGGYYRNSGCCR